MLGEVLASLALFGVTFVFFVWVYVGVFVRKVTAPLSAATHDLNVLILLFASE